MKKIIIATRGSALALWQANFIRNSLLRVHRELEAELLLIKTKGDKILDVPLAKVGGKGLFVKEIETALLHGDADIAVHSMKDVPMVLPDGLVLGTVPLRADPTDSFLSEKYRSLSDLPPGSAVGTSSLRRQAQILALRPDLNIRSLRGNVETRLRKLQNGDFDAIVLASAALERMDLKARYRQVLPPPLFLPAAGQGALGIEMKSDREDLKELLGFLEHGTTRICVEAERAFLRKLDGGCQVPLACHAELKGKELIAHALAAYPDGTSLLRARKKGPAESPCKLGEDLAEELLIKGAGKILETLYLQQ